MPGALVTRPREESEAISHALSARGFEVWVEPLIDIVPKSNVAIPFDGVQGLIATSANGVRALAAATDRRDIRLWAVGDSTAQRARALGFSQVESAGGDVSKLAALIQHRADPEDGSLIHIAGSHVAGDLAVSLDRAGFRTQRIVLYEANAATKLSDTLLALLDKRKLEVATFLSPRTARTFVSLTQACGRAEFCSGIGAYGLSEAVVQALAGLQWRRIRAAPSPDLAALLATIDQDLGSI